MCGIAGIFSQSDVSLDVIEQAKNSLYSRGPDVQQYIGWDAEGEQCNGPVRSALIHTRLSVRDLNPRANQPMVDDSGKVWICYNGEVYNWEKEKAVLESEGYPFYTTSDTEFILNYYLQHGISGLENLRGMFAICIVDFRINKVFLCRDRMGQKPLYYSSYDGMLTFGSTFRSVWTLLDQKKKTLNQKAIDAYLAHRYIPAPQTLCHEISKLENGYLLEWDLTTRELQKKQYWDATKASQQNWLQLFSEAIDIRTVADRPVGVFLSGGVDSTAIASVLAEKGHQDITAFTASFQDSRFDESSEAKRTALELGLPLQEIQIPQNIELDLFDRIVDDLDEPFADPSSFPTWLLCQETVKHVTVVLGGDGGDELFGGYKRYSKHLKSSWRQNLSLWGSPFDVPDSKNGKLLSELRMTWEEAYGLRFSGFTPAQRQRLIPSIDSKSVHYWRDSQFSEEGLNSPLQQMLSTDYANYLPEYILKKGDLCSMAHGLELRCPFMDHELFAALKGMPEDQRFTAKPKQALSSVSPQVERVLNLKKKGFNPPLTQWLRQSWKDRYEGIGGRLASNSLNLIEADGVDQLVDDYQAGKESLAERILQLLILDRILSRYSFSQ
ncbi:asparagine synthase (glutamine-hydrolyzing) [Endozoicomonas sp. (ex Bugula neritina AB1)]|nr:asparagine synthase (glutamine-hydrolyzing) [Endozoicomonas sp. (ex Bugula neritina AB1)]